MLTSILKLNPSYPRHSLKTTRLFTLIPTYISPFRLPQFYEKKARGLRIIRSHRCHNCRSRPPPSETLHKHHWQLFSKPSAVLAALGGPDSIRKTMSTEDSVPHQWAPSSPDSVGIQLQSPPYSSHQRPYLSATPSKNMLVKDGFPKKCP